MFLPLTRRLVRLTRKLVYLPISLYLPNEKPAQRAGVCLLFSLFENDVLAELFGVLFELNLARNELFVLARPIHLPRGGVLEYYESVL